MHIVLDTSAMAAADAGNVMASRLIHRSHAEPGWFLYAPHAFWSKPTGPAPEQPST